MREQLIQYTELLFAGAPGAEEIKQEILQNTLDRYDDLIAQGKTPEAAYRLAIAGIGDISEILGRFPSDPEPFPTYGTAEPESAQEQERIRKNRAVAIVVFILSPIPLFLLSELGLDTLGLCSTLGLIAAGTYLLLLSKKAPLSGGTYDQTPEYGSHSARKRAMGRVLGLSCLIIYLLVSFLTKAWFITWLIFPIFACIRGLVNAILDLKEATRHEN